MDLTGRLNETLVKAVNNSTVFQSGSIVTLNSTLEAVYKTKSFSSKAKSIISEVYGVNLNSTLNSAAVDKVKSILFQMDTKGISGRSYWYFNGSTANPVFDRLSLLEKFMEAVSDLKNLSTSAKDMINKTYGINLYGTLNESTLTNIA